MAARTLTHLASVETFEGLPILPSDVSLRQLAGLVSSMDDAAPTLSAPALPSSPALGSFLDPEELANPSADASGAMKTSDSLISEASYLAYSRFAEDPAPTTVAREVSVLEPDDNGDASMEDVSTAELSMDIDAEFAGILATNNGSRAVTSPTLPSGPSTTPALPTLACYASIPIPPAITGGAPAALSLPALSHALLYISASSASLDTYAADLEKGIAARTTLRDVLREELRQARADERRELQMVRFERARRNQDVEVVRRRSSARRRAPSGSSGLAKLAARRASIGRSGDAPGTPPTPTPPTDTAPPPSADSLRVFSREAGARNPILAQLEALVDSDVDDIQKTPLFASDASWSRKAWTGSRILQNLAVRKPASLRFPVNV
jgi:hypothetical protein